MALFGKIRDISLFRHLNKELLGNIINQQCAVYKRIIDKTPINIYGESSTEKYYNPPVLFNALITVDPKSSNINDLGIDFEWSIKVAFLRDHLVEANLVPQIGDIILYQESYFEIDNVSDTQYFAGKNPDYPYDINPLNPGLNDFGYNVSIICSAHYVPADKNGLSLQRL